MATINVLMCGGRRTGKTSIMAAIEENIQSCFSEGDIILKMQELGKLQACRDYITEVIFENELWENEYFYPDQETGSDNKTPFSGKMQFKRKPANLDVCFTDVPGEWFVEGMGHEAETQELLCDSQVLIIAVDTPHMVEPDGQGVEGGYHDTFNRVEDITNMIRKAWQGSKDHRMLLFVPLKCEKYWYANEMDNVLSHIRTGYMDLLNYIEQFHKDMCTVAVAPCLTMGGLEFMNFVYPDDGLGADSPEYVFGSDGQRIINRLTQYSYRITEKGREYKPQYCEQPLLYTLMFIIHMSKMRNQKILRKLWEMIRQMPDQNILNAAADSIRPKLMKDHARGYAVLNDPQGIF